MTERYFTDRNDPEVRISESRIKMEYGMSIADGSIDPAEKTYAQYLEGRMAVSGGSLSEMPGRPTFSIIIRETLARKVEVEADSADEAIEIVQSQYYRDDIILTASDFEGASFALCCSECESEFDDSNLRIVSEDTPLARLVCDRCVESLEDAGVLTCCEQCGRVFDGALLQTNPSNGETELCPYCKEVWCE